MGAFWEEKTLSEMTHNEWESLCDGCGRCCLHKLEDSDTGQYYYTNIACRLLDEEKCQCKQYGKRKTLVKDCLLLDPTDEKQLSWLPMTCAYRRIAEHKPLDWWHPLVSGNQNSVHESGISVRGHTVSEENVDSDELEEHIIHWINF